MARLYKSRTKILARKLILSVWFKTEINLINK